MGRVFNLVSFTVVLGALFGACTRPMIRSEVAETPPAVSGSANPADPRYEMSDLKKRLWVLPFIENTSPSKELANIQVAELMQPKIIEVFSKANSPFIVPESEQFNLRELNVDSALPPTEVAKLARGSGVIGFLRGEITSLELKESLSPEGLLKSKTVELKIGVTYELYDTTSSRRIAAGTEIQKYAETRSDLFGTESGLPEINQKIEDLSTKLAQRLLQKTAHVAEKMGWEGRVLRTDSSRVYINAGRSTGILVGDTLKVVDGAKDITDPQSGAFMGRAPGRMKGTLKVIQYFGLDGCIAIVQSGGGVRQGDRVELY